jgi:hypothetical protein
VASSAFLKRAGQTVRSPRGRGKAKEAQFAPPAPDHTVDLQRKRDQLNARVAELQWDLGGLVYEMAVRDRIQVDVLVRRAAVLQAADSELAEVERILRLEETSTAGECKSCGAPHSTGAAYCWQCGQPLLEEVHPDQIAAPPPAGIPAPAGPPRDATAEMPSPADPIHGSAVK